MKETGSVMKAVDILEEAVNKMTEKKEGYEAQYESTHTHRFLHYAEIVDEDIQIIKGLEQKYGLIPNIKEEQEEMEM